MQDAAHTLLHDRTAFTDWPEPEPRRHRLRLWLAPVFAWCPARAAVWRRRQVNGRRL